MIPQPFKLLLFVALCALLSWYSWLLGYATEPGNSGINPLGVLAAALIVSLLGGGSDLKAFVRRIVRVRADWTTYATALLLPAALAGATVALLPAAEIDYAATDAMARWPDAVDGFIIMFLFVGLGEEPGWRGWLQPFFARRMAPLAAALAVAPFWALWHYPMLGRDIPVEQVGPFLLSLTSACVVLGWLTNRTRGGVLPAMLCHASVNGIGSAWLFNFVAEADKTELRWINAVLWAGAAAIVAIRTKGQLGDLSEETPRELRVQPSP
jgi:membrane protease YdiL (CAAX protease family)